MLKLKGITKEYITGDFKVNALRGVSLEFRESEFVSILGQSGCGKTTLLNIIGGLDKYTSGDLIINGVSTKEYKDSDWDTYRNHSIGFVFQSYNLIPHQSVLANVELALTLSGVSKAERKKRAIEALEIVGLGDQIHKKPNQMSGGQMQRVAIARALVNNPDILLADEPTGALDSETSVQVMNILKEISKNKLVIMVTHNPELATEYSTRIINLLDGRVVSDSNPYTQESEVVGKHNANLHFEGDGPFVAEGNVEDIKVKSKKTKKKELNKKKKKSMSFFTALSLSLNNLLTKKGRTILTSFAGSIGIIGIALILSVSAGVNAYIDSIEESTMSSYPLTINESYMDSTSLLASFMSQNKDVEKKDDEISSNNVMVDMIKAMTSGVTTNNLSKFKDFIENGNSGIKDYTTDIKYQYLASMSTYTPVYDKDGNFVEYKRNLNGLSELMNEIMPNSSGSSSSGSSMSSMMMASSGAWTELVGDMDYIKSQYTLVDGKFPENKNEVILIVNKDHQVSDYILYILGIEDTKDIKNYFDAVIAGNTENVTLEPSSYTFEELYSYTFKAIINSDYYKMENGLIVEKNDDEIQEAVKNAQELKIVGIVTPSDDSTAVGSIAYLPELMSDLIAKGNNSDVVKAQMENSDTDLFSGNKFDTKEYTLEDAEMLRAMFVAQAQAQGQTDYVAIIQAMQPIQIVNMANNMLVTDATYDGNMQTLGYVDFNKPSSIIIYPKDFESKDAIADIISSYNSEQKEADVINYTDTVALLMSSVTTIVNVISYVLIAFVAISLIVSSIMIGVITLISVQERTKEIGILRAIGASKKDVSRVFNAETLIVGFSAGAIGILVSLVLIVIINIILHALTGLSTLNAVLPVGAAFILVGISMLLTLVSGLIPSSVAAKKDPVIALRTE